MTQSHQLAIRSTKLLAPKLDYFLIDGSGSMHGKWWQTLEALDTYREVLLKANANAHGIVSVFTGGDVQLLQRDELLSKWQSFRNAPLGSTWGGTPLYDAIVMMGQHLRDLAPENCSIVIVTDGQENESRNNAAQAKGVLDWCRAHGWTVTFLGADFENSSQAKLLGATEANSIGIRKELIAEAGRLLAKKRLEGKDGEFSSDEKLKFGGYLGHG